MEKIGFPWFIQAGQTGGRGSPVGQVGAAGGAGGAGGAVGAGGAGGQLLDAASSNRAGGGVSGWQGMPGVIWLVEASVCSIFQVNKSTTLIV